MLNIPYNNPNSAHEGWPEPSIKGGIVFLQRIPGILPVGLDPHLEREELLRLPQGAHVPQASAETCRDLNLGFLYEQGFREPQPLYCKKDPKPSNLATV